MTHTYASVADFKAFMGPPDPGTAMDAAMLDVLEDASRAVDDYCGRSRFGSGFGPRVGTNHYSGEPESASRTLWLDDDLLSVTSLDIALTAGGTPVTWTENTDFYALPFDTTPKRRLDAIVTRALIFGSAPRGIALAGVFGYSNETAPLAATTAEALDTSETGLDVSDGTVCSPGQTLLIDAEQLYVTDVATDTLTVIRGVNGTTAASHLTAAAIAVYRYPRQVRSATLQLAQRRFRARDAGLDGSYGGQDLPVTGYRETERSLLRAKLWRLRCVRTADGHLAEVGEMAA